MVRNNAPEAMPKTVRSASIRGSNILVTAQNIMLPKLNNTVPQTQYMIRQGWAANCMCLRLYKYTPKPMCEFNNNTFDTGSSYGVNTLQNIRQTKQLSTSTYIQLYTLQHSMYQCEQNYSLCLKKGTPTLSIVTLKRINGF